jgi:hypothetical protein
MSSGMAPIVLLWMQVGQADTKKCSYMGTSGVCFGPKDSRWKETAKMTTKTTLQTVPRIQKEAQKHNRINLKLQNRINLTTASSCCVRWYIHYIFVALKRWWDDRSFKLVGTNHIFKDLFWPIWKMRIELDNNWLSDQELKAKKQINCINGIK